MYFLAIFSLAMSALLLRWAAAPPDVIGFWRLGVAGLCLVPLALQTGGVDELWRHRRTRLPLVLLSAMFFFAHLWTFTYAAQNTRIAHCMILFATNPLWTALGNRIFFGEKLSRRLIASYALAVIAIFVLVRHSLAFDTGLVAGDLVAILSAFFFAGYMLTGKTIRRTTSNASYTCVMYLFTGLFFGVSGLARGVDFIHWEWNTWVAILGLIALPTMLGHLLVSWLMRHMDINLLSCGKLAEPVISTIAAAWIFQEQPTGEVGLAFVLTALAVLILFLPRIPGFSRPSH